jgi:fructosamine-3-kinase
MAMGGRPFYDLAKLYMLELYWQPSQRDVFLREYEQHVALPDDFRERLRMYLLQEALGMIHFLGRTGQEDAKQHAIDVLDELSANCGVMARLLA